MSPIRRTLLICCALLLAFTALAWTAVQTKSSTADEPYHVVAGWLHLWQHDFRLDAEDPPLWNIWAALPNPPHSLQSDFDKHDWSTVPLETDTEYAWSVNVLFRTPGNDPESFIARSRAMMLILSVLLGATIAAWSWRLAHSLGYSPAIAAVAATTLFCFDPNFLAHGALVKNDVASSLAMLVLIASIWAAGRKLTLPRLLAMGLFCGIALTVKFSGVLITLIALALLFTRIVLPHPWAALGRQRQNWIQRITAAIVASTLVAVVAWVFVWFAYDFHFTPTADPRSQMDLRPLYGYVIRHKWQLAHTDGITLPIPTDQDLMAVTPPRFLGLMQFADEHHLLPQPWLAGLLFTYATSMLRGTFLCGKFSCIGWWWYFPLAMLVKTPLATLAASLLALIVGVTQLPRLRRFETLWPILCLTVPAFLYLAAAMASNLNLGIRHVLPIYPFIFITIGLAIARIWQSRPKLVAPICALLLIGLLAETLPAHPNYLAFFNTAAGGSRGGLRLLSDSNLDWGQDLKLLAAWQQKNPTKKLYLAYFGTDDPAYYGIHYTNIQEGYWDGPPVEPLGSPGIIAISATTLQGTYMKGNPLYSYLWHVRPIDVLGGSIYLFRYPLQPQDDLPAGNHLIN